MTMDHISGFAAAASTALLTSIWQGILIVAAVAFFLRLVPRLGAAARAMVWLAVFLLVAALDLVSLPANPSRPTTAGFRLDPRWALALCGLWAALSLVRLARLFAGAIRLHAIARRATSLPLAPTFGKTALCASPEVDRPGVFGFLAPRILLPAGFAERLSRAELQAVLLHEQEHLRRRDVWINLLQKVGLALLPLNPVLAWVERRLCRERELACDDHVLRHTGARKAYAACLAHLAEDSLTRRPLALALGLAGHGSELARRIHRILAAPQTALGRRAATFCSTLLVAALLAGGVELARCPRLVRFATAPTGTQALAAAASGQPFARVGTGDHPRLIQAVARMDAAQPAPLRTPTAVPKPRRARVQRRNASAWLVMTRLAVEQGGPEPTLVPVRFIVPLTGHRGLSYATVPTGSGWLVFQL